MSTTTRGIRLHLLLGLVAVLFIAGSARAQLKDAIEQYKQRMQIAAQQAENDIRKAIADAQKVLPTDPKRAADILDSALDRLEDDKYLTGAKRDSLRKELKDRLRAAEDAARKAGDRDAAKAQKDAITGAKKADQEKQAQDNEKIQRMLTNIRELQRAGKTVEAAALAQELARRYPDSPAFQASRATTSVADSVREIRDLNLERERRMVMVYRDVERSSMPPIGDIEFPKDWAEKTKMRKNSTPLTKQERAILEALDSPISINLKDTKLEEVLDFLEKSMGQTFVVDKPALESAAVTYDTPVSIKAARVTTRTVLKKLLNELGLTYVVKDQAIQITSQEKARAMLTTRTYYLADLVGTYDFRMPPGFSQVQAYNNIMNLIATIYQSVDPDSWAVNERGGYGTIVYNPATMSLIVKASAEVHYSLQNSLR